MPLRITFRCKWLMWARMARTLSASMTSIRPLLGSGWLNPAAGCTPYATTAALIAASANAATCENESRPYFSKFPYLSSIVQIANQDDSNYNGLQVTLTQHPWHGFSYLAGYTFAHALDESGADWNGSALPSNEYNVRADYGDSMDDVRNRLTYSATYALPDKKGYHQMLAGWKLNGVANIQSALPWNVNDTTDDISGVGGKEDRWDFFGNPANFSGLGYASVPYFAGSGASGVRRRMQPVTRRRRAWILRTLRCILGTPTLPPWRNTAATTTTAH